MSRRKYIWAPAAALAVIAGGSQAPAGQPPLARLTTQSPPQVEMAFNAANLRYLAPAIQERILALPGVSSAAEEGVNDAEQSGPERFRQRPFLLPRHHSTKLRLGNRVISPSHRYELFTSEEAHWVQWPSPRHPCLGTIAMKIGQGQV
jgi:hypothetical protein